VSSSIRKTIHEIESIDRLAKEDRWVNQLHPLVKFCVTVLFLVLTVSFSKYDLAGLAGMLFYPVFLFTAGELSLKDALRRLRIVLPLVCMIGLANPFLDRTVWFTLGSLPVTGGVISMLTLMLKSVLTVLGAYLLTATTPVEHICYAMRRLHVPDILVTEFLLIYRYITVLLSETHRVTQAYALRAPGSKGIRIREWGSLTGQLLLRSMDRAERVYRSMLLRGFSGHFPFDGGEKPDRGSLIYLCVWSVLLLILRFVPVIRLAGSLFVR